MTPKACKPALRGWIVSAMVVAACVSGLGVEVSGEDWPTYRHDAGRTSASREQLPDKLHPQWSRQYPELIAAWLGEFPHLRFDANYEPIVVGRTLVFGSSDDDSVTALETDTGKMKWRFYANGPVRLAPVAHQGRIYFGADDGVFYCLDAETGTLVWKFDTALSGRKGFIEDRLTTICPIRGGPVVENGQVRFTAGIWRFEKSALFTLDAKTGKVIRTQPGIRSQGYPSAVGRWLYLPNGRASGVRLTRDKSAWAGGLGGWAGYWDHLVTGTGDWRVRMGGLYKGGKAPTGQVCEPGPGLSPICFYRPVIDGDVIYYNAAKKVVPRQDLPGPELGDLVACSLKDPTLMQAKDAKGKPVLSRRGKPQTKLVLKELWRLPNKELLKALGITPPKEKKRKGKRRRPSTGPFVIVAMKAGNRLYGHYGPTLFAVDLPAGTKPATVSWESRVEGTPATMLAADGKVVVVTREGHFHCFGAKKVTPKVYPKDQRVLPRINDQWVRKAGAILSQTKVRQGYCLVLGLRTGRLVEELFRRSAMHIIAVHKDPKLVRALREKLSYLSDPCQVADKQQKAKDGTPLTTVGSARIAPNRRRVVICEADPRTFAFPPYMASLIVSEDADALALQPKRVKALCHVLRPYGGTMCLELSTRGHDALVQAAGAGPLHGAELRRTGNLALLTRAGAPAGSGNWTHEWADAANTLKSEDRLRTPLAMLWTGGRSARRAMYFDRHYVPPPPVVIDGRMFIAGPTGMAAVDIYTGRILWEVKSKLFTQMTRGAGGCHTVGTPDAIYVSTRRAILRFDPVTGTLLSEFPLPTDRGKNDMWGRARVWKDTLVTGLGASRRPSQMLALDRRTGKIRWRVKAEATFSLVAVGNDTVFTWDGSRHDLRRLKAARRGGPAPRIAGRVLRAFDARNGKELWRVKTDSVVGWLSYSEHHDVLVASTKKRIHVYSGRDGRELWHRYSEGIGFRGHPGRVWQKVILWHDWMIDQRGPGLAYDLMTGEQISRPHPVTLEPAPWEFVRHGHHCNHAIASENLVTFRSGNASFVDLTSLGTGTYPGVRSGCTNSLVVAGGILNSPMYSHLCVCGYEFFASLALTHMPDVEAWTYRPNKLDFLRAPAPGRARRLGINFNAPGERRAPNGTLWFGLGGRYGYGLSGITVKRGATKRFGLPASQVKSEQLNWIFATGIEGLTSFAVPLCRDKTVKPEPYTVRLYFMEPDDMKPGQRVFSVNLQGQQVLKDFDVVKAAGGPMRGVIKEFKGIQAGTKLVVAFTPGKSKPVISGIEVVSASAGTIPPEVHRTMVEASVGKPVAVKLFYSDVDGPGPFTFKITKRPTKGSLSGRGPEFTYTAKPGAVGADAFTWVVNDGQKDSHPATVRIKLLATNVAPKARDLQVRATAGEPTPVVLPFSDPDQQPGRYRFEVVRRPGGGTVQWQSHNRFVYTAKPGFAGIDRLTWKVNDGQADSNVATVTVSVKPDTQPPTVAWIDSAGPNSRVKVVFSEPVDTKDAGAASSYAIDNNVMVKSAKLSDDGKAVTLVTSALKEGVAYSLTINRLRDRAAKPNGIRPGTRMRFKYVFVGNGLWGEYYEGKNFKGKKVGERIDPYIDVDWRKKPPFAHMKPGKPFSVRWTGRLKADHSEQYMVYFFRGWEHNRNPVRVWVDGKLLLNESYGPVQLEAGKTYDLKVEFSILRPAHYADYYSLRWSSLSTPKQTIPQPNLGTTHRPSPAPAAGAQAPVRR